MTPESSAGPPASALTICAVRSMTTSSPGLVWTLTAISLAIVADGRYQACSLPSSAATRSCSAFTDGSSSFCSSPTGARSMNWRIPSDGLVAVSLERSMNVATQRTSSVWDGTLLCLCVGSSCLLECRCRRHSAAPPPGGAPSALVPEGLGLQVAGDAELTRHQCRPGEESLDHHQGFVFDLIGVERLMHVTQMVADAAAERANVAEQLDGDVARLRPDDLRPARGGAQPRGLRAGPVDEIIENVDGFARAALNHHRHESLTGAPDLAYQ